MTIFSSDAGFCCSVRQNPKACRASKVKQIQLKSLPVSGQGRGTPGELCPASVDGRPRPGAEPRASGVSNLLCGAATRRGGAAAGVSPLLLQVRRGAAGHVKGQSAHESDLSSVTFVQRMSTLGHHAERGAGGVLSL